MLFTERRDYSCLFAQSIVEIHFKFLPVKIDFQFELSKNTLNGRD